MTHERLEMMRVSALCRYFRLFLGLNCKFVCVKHSEKKNPVFPFGKKKITTEYFALFTPMLIVFTKCSWKGKKKNLLALVCYSHPFVTVRHFNAPWMVETFDRVYFCFSWSYKDLPSYEGAAQHPPHKLSRRRDPKWRLIHRFPARSILNPRLSSDTLRWRNLLDLTGLKLSLEKLLSSPCFNSAPS